MNFNLNSGFGQIVGQFPFTGSGKVLFVGDSGTANREMLQQLFRNDTEGEVRFFSTLNAANDECTANAGDIIYVAAGHTESIATATALALDVAGVRVIGLGTGTDRPTFTMITATTATINVTGANVTIENCIIDMTGVDAVAIGLDISAAGFALLNCQIVTADSSGQAVIGLYADSNCDDLRIEDCEFVGGTTAGTKAAIELQGLSARVKIKNNTIVGAFDYTAGAPILMDTYYVPDIEISGNFIWNNTAASTSCITGGATTSLTGFISNNFLRIEQDGGTCFIVTNGTVAKPAAATGLVLYLNFGVNAATERGMDIGEVST